MLTNAQYLDANDSMFAGPDETVIECRTTKIVTIRKDQTCMCCFHEPLHIIKAGKKAVRDKAIADGKWGSCYVCLPCLERWWNHCERYGDCCNEGQNKLI